MKLLKQILPFLLAAIIIAGGFFGIYGMEMLIPNEKDKIVRSDKRAANQLLYVEEGETLTIYPWDHYDPDALLTLKQYGIEYGIEADSPGFTEYAYRLDTFLYQIFSDGNETESPGQIVTNIEDFHFFESVQDLFESMEVTLAGDFVFLKDKTCNAVWNRTEYRLDVASSIFLGNGNLPICYLHLVPVNRDPVSKEQMQKASEKLEAMHREALSLYDEFIKTFSTWEYADGEDAAMENEDGYSGSNTAWKLYLEKTSNENLLTQYLADISDLNGIEIYYLAEFLIYQDYYSFSYDGEILMVFSVSENVSGSNGMVVLYYDPVQELFTGYSIKP